MSAADARNAQATIDRIIGSGQQTLATLKAFDVNGALFVFVECGYSLG